MLRYFATRRASVVLGAGAFFVIIGFIMSAFRYCSGGCMYAGSPPTDVDLLIFSLFFYGSLLVAVGVSTPILLHLKSGLFSKLRNRIILVSVLLLLAFFFVPVPGAHTIYRMGEQPTCPSIGPVCSLNPIFVYGSVSYWLTGYGGITRPSFSYTYFSGYQVAFG